jgi:hypothetical protein
VDNSQHECCVSSVERLCQLSFTFYTRKKNMILEVFMAMNMKNSEFIDLTPYSLKNSFRFKLCKSVHHRTIQINHQPDATIFQFIILMFIYSSTCFGRFPAHHQELSDCSGGLWFYLHIGVIIVLLFVNGPAGLTTNTARLSPRQEDKTRGCHCNH